MLAARLRAPRSVDLEAVPIPPLGEQDLLVRVDAASICGTDLRIIAGRKSVGRPLPAILGHEFAGEIVQTAASSGWRVGDRIVVAPVVACGQCASCRAGRPNVCDRRRAFGYELDGGFAEYVRIPSETVANLHAVPEGASQVAASLVEPLACCVRGQRLARISPGDRVLVLGAGPIGQLHVRLARARGAARVVVSDPVSARRALALGSGADEALDPGSDTFSDRLAAALGTGAEVVVLATGATAAVDVALEAAAKGGRILFFAGGLGTGPVDLDRVHYRELELLGTSSSGPEDFREAIRLVASGEVRVEDLVSHRFALRRFGEALEVAGSGEAMKVTVTPHEEP